jgi:hypothetical protein
MNTTIQSKKGAIWGAIAISMLALTLSASAQSRITSSVMGSGGSVDSGSGIILNGTSGQPVIGPAGGTSTRVLQGFWYTMAKPASLGVAVTGSSISGLQADVFPNPCNAATVLRLTIGSRTDLRASLYDLLGNELEVLHDGSVEPGQMQIGLTASLLAAGRYVIRVVSGKESRALPLLVVR